MVGVSRRRALQAVGVAAAGVALAPGQAHAAEPYLVGCGLADITGPAAENGMMGYSLPQQRTTGIHQRLRARAFVIVDAASGRRIAWCCADQGILPIAVFREVVARLARTYGGLYSEQNVSLTATHTHAGPGGCSHHLAYNLASLGFQAQTFEAVVSGIVEAIGSAHADLAPGSITVGRGELADASVQRSRVAFDRNPQADRDAYPLGVDTRMTVLRLRRGAADVGAISWFPTHATSMTNTNTLISGDNKGYASYTWEHDAAGVRYLDGAPGFVAAFPQTNAGDMSPNLNLRQGSGPTEDEFENTRIIGQRQYDAARRAFDGATTPVAGGVDGRLRWVDMGAVQVDARWTPDGRPHRTASGVIGVSTLAGSVEDGPGIPGLVEGTRSPVADLVDLIDVAVPPELASAQNPKASLLPTGLVQATPDVVPLQLIRIGQLCVVGGPGEFTIVAGLRIRRAVAAALGVPLDDVLLQGYTNGYSQYVTTPEEYESQQYEGASTLFGRYTLPAYQQEFAALASGAAAPPGPRPADPATGRITLEPGVVFDSPGLGRRYGQVLTDAAAAYTAGQTVSTVFVTGHPKNDLRRGGTFLEVQRQDGGSWVRVLDDGDWATRFRWTRTNVLLGTSTATITWTVAPGTPAGTYRIVHRGTAKDAVTGALRPFTGTSRTFTVT